MDARFTRDSNPCLRHDLHGPQAMRCHVHHRDDNRFRVRSVRCRVGLVKCRVRLVRRMVRLVRCMVKIVRYRVRLAT